MEGNNQEDHRLPPRLFATNRFPNGRLNIYSKPELLAFIRHVLRDTPELEYLRRSCFGKLFDLPSRQCPVSCKLIHAMLTRQLVCEDNSASKSLAQSPVCLVDRSLLDIPLIEKTSLKHAKILFGSSSLEKEIPHHW
ncbi:hypothetical protein Bca52824_004057 [Brassica carinata]|uniref:Uncharacterized protein n=1 Tax=Brassica carinata TaxID=52824 RepID=A0A8X8BGD1_BRACI|nr:hypothetical protein Bca52824_004057 [Brassica carinata]